MERDTCFVCEVCNGCFKHWQCSKKLCKGDFDKTCEGEPRKNKLGVDKNENSSH